MCVGSVFTGGGATWQSVSSHHCDLAGRLWCSRTHLKNFQILSPWALCLAPALFYVFSAKKKERQKKIIFPWLLEELKMHQNIAKMPGMWRLWQVQVCSQELTDVRYIASVWAHSQNNQLLWHQFTANNGAISSSPSLLPLSFSPLSLWLPPIPLCFCDEYITLPSSQHFILRWMFVKWNGKMSYSLIPLSFPSLHPSLQLSLPLFALHSAD